MRAKACLGDYVWLDLNADGLQNEQPLVGWPNVVVRLFACSSNTLLATTMTDATGRYGFCDLRSGDYRVQFITPADHAWTSRCGVDRCLDSDVSTSGVEQGWTACVTLRASETNRCVDGGLIPLEPCMQVEKSADRRVVGVFQPVTYTYVVTNCGAVTLTDIAVNDDNGTPDYAGDDLTVGNIAVLQPGATETLTRTVRLPVQLCDSGTGTPSGEIIIVDVTADGNYLATFIQSFN